MRLQLCLLGLAAPLAITACGDSSSSSPGTDTGSDVTVDADAGADTSDDASTDATPDGGADASVDTTADIVPDIDPTLDSDEDGLTDLDEITIWGTSPTVADTDGDGFSDGQEVNELAFDPEVDNFQFNPLVADRPEIDIEFALAPVIYATYETTTGTTETIGSERSSETSSSNSRSWGGSNSVAVEQSHTVGTSIGFDGWKLQGSVSYEYSYSTTNESTSEWSQEQSTENSNSLSAMESFEESNEIASSGGVLGMSVTINNPGNIAYFLEGLTLTAYELDPLDPENISPVGNLTYLDGANTFPRTRLEPGETSAPLTFDAELDLPTVKALLANSRNLMIAPGTWNVEGDGTVNFELASTSINARTAEIRIDYGFDRDTEVYRVSTVANADRNYITVDEALTEILRIPYTEGVSQIRRTADGEPEDTVPMLTSVRSYAADDAENTMWTVVHHYPINNGADYQTDQYHPFSDELAFGDLQLQKGHTLQLIRIVDVDRDGLGERSEYAYGTDPNDADTDDDGCTDGFEVNGWTVDNEGTEVFYRSSPVLPNSDFDLFNDCEEYVAGTDPMDADNTPPTATATIAVSDGTRAEFEVAFDDAETPVLELRYTIDGGAEQTLDVSGMTSPVTIEEEFTTAGNHTFSVVSFDGALLSTPSEVTYNVQPPSNGLAYYWPIEGSTDDTYYGAISSSVGSAEMEGYRVRFVTDRHGAGRGAANVRPSGESGILTTSALSLGTSYTVSLWVRFDDIYSDMVLFGLDGGVSIGVDSGGFDLFDSRSDDYLNTSIARHSMSGSSWDGEDVYYHVVAVVSGDTATLYLNGTSVAAGTIGGADFSTTCGAMFGHPSGGELECTGADPAEAHENGLNGSFDDLRIYTRALSEYEVRALELEE